MASADPWTTSESGSYKKWRIDSARWLNKNGRWRHYRKNSRLFFVHRNNKHWSSSCGSSLSIFGLAPPSWSNFLHFHTVFRTVWPNNGLASPNYLELVPSGPKTRLTTVSYIRLILKKEFGWVLFESQRQITPECDTCRPPGRQHGRAFSHLCIYVGYLFSDINRIAGFYNWENAVT